MRMLEEPVRNSPRVLISHFILLLFIMAVVSLSIADMMTAPLPVIAALTVLLMAYDVIWWKRTTLRATDTELIREYSFLYSTRKVVPYSKIASVNVIRTAFDRILGTATIQVNINSAVNSMAPEISFVFDKDTADAVRTELSGRMYGNAHTAQEEHIYESIIPFTNRDSILHGLFGTSTWALLGVIASLALGIGTELIGSRQGSELLVGMVILAVMFLLPLIGMIIKYYNFKVYRFGDTVYLSHGAIRLYRTSFKINRINSIRIKRTLIARMLGKASLEMEVVGLTSADDEQRPVLCIMTDMENIRKVIREVAPFFEFEEGVVQPKAAGKVWLMKAVYTTAATVVLASVICYVLNDGSVDRTLLRYGWFATVGAVAVLSFVSAYRGYKVDLFGMGEDVFMFQYGIVDRCMSVMQYDRVQIAEMYAWPLAARLGLARCQVRMLSSMGAAATVSGYYPREDLERIQEEVMARIRDGRYDYRKLSF